MGTKYQGSPTEIRALDAYIALMRASSTFSSTLNSGILENNLTPAQFGILEALFHLGPLSQKSLGQKVLSTKGNITTIVDNLEKQYLVDDFKLININTFNSKYQIGLRCKNKHIFNSKYCKLHNKHLIHGDFLEPPSKELCFHFIKDGNYI